jgi:hypothetical protein
MSEICRMCAIACDACMAACQAMLTMMRQGEAV